MAIRATKAEKRATDTLTLELQDDVAKELGDRDADALMARVATAARTVAWIADDAWRRHVAPKARTIVTGSAPSARAMAMNSMTSPRAAT